MSLWVKNVTRFFCRTFFFIAYSLPTITLKNVYKPTVGTPTRIMDLWHYIVLALAGYYIIDKHISQKKKKKIVEKIIISKD